MYQVVHYALIGRSYDFTLYVLRITHYGRGVDSPLPYKM